MTGRASGAATGGRENPGKHELEYVDLRLEATKPDDHSTQVAP